MPQRPFALLLFSAICGGGCAGPSLDVPSRGQARWSVELDPSSEPDGVASNFRGRIRDAPVVGEPWLFHGELSDYFERAVRRGEVPASLRERAVPLRYWRDGTDCWLQPVAWLEADATYTLAFEGVGELRSLRSEAEARPRAARLFPPPGSPKYRVAVVCGELEGEAANALTLEPGGVALQLLPGMAGMPRAGCVTLTSDSDVSDVAVSPPLLGRSLNDPAPWLPSRSLAQPPPACADGEPLGGSCLSVQDDRVLVTPRGEDQLWLLRAPQAVVAAPAARRTALLRGLLPSTSLTLEASVLSSGGQREDVTLTVRTERARRHLILNEVLANPLGAEANGEWIELLNDSERPASLEELWLEDAGGRVALPAAELEPGELALLVGAQFRASSLDVPVPEGVQLLRLPSLGTRGLANGGEALLLVGPEGTLSRFPQLEAAHAGRSLARLRGDAADDDATAFAEHGGPGASPGAPNSFDTASD